MPNRKIRDPIRDAIDFGSVGLSQSRATRTPMVFADKLPVEGAAGIYTIPEEINLAGPEVVRDILSPHLPSGLKEEDRLNLNDVYQRGLIQLNKSSATKEDIRHEDTHSVFRSGDLPPEVMERLWKKFVPEDEKSWFSREPLYKEKFGPPLLDEAVAYGMETNNKKLLNATIQELMKVGLIEKASSLQRLKDQKLK